MRRKSHTIRRATRKRYSAEEKIRIVLEACAASTRSPSCAVGEGIAEGLYYS